MLPIMWTAGLQSPSRVHFTCKRCAKKKQQNPTTAPFNLPRGHPESSSSTQSLGVCSFCGCRNPVPFSFTDTPGMPEFCHIHEISQKYAAALQKPGPKSMPTSTSRPFNKSKLHPVRPDDRQFVKKRKRSAEEKSTASIQNISRPPSGQRNTNTALLSSSKQPKKVAVVADISAYQGLVNARASRPLSTITPVPNPVYLR